MIRMCAAALLVWASAVAGAVPLAQAQQLEPRSYVNTPTGLQFLIAGYTDIRGAVLPGAEETLQDAEIEGHVGVVSYVHSLDLRGRSGKAGLIASYGCLSGKARALGQSVERQLCGLVDPRFYLTLNFYGAPALSVAEFPRYQQKVIVGARLQVQAPLGRYDPDKLLNIGTHRWLVQPQLGISKAWQRWILELMTSVDLYTDNRDFFGGRTRAQDPLYAAQLHAIYSFGSGIWGAVSGTYYAGGSIRVDGRETARRLSNVRLGATLTIPLSRSHSLKLAASHGVIARSGSDFDAVGIAWQYRWDLH